MNKSIILTVVKTRDGLYRIADHVLQTLSEGFNTIDSLIANIQFLIFDKMDVPFMKMVYDELVNEGCEFMEIQINRTN